MTDRELSVEELEEGTELYLDFDKISKVAAQTPGVMPVVVQNVDTKEVILVAYVNKAAFQKSSDAGLDTFLKGCLREQGSLSEKYRVRHRYLLEYLA